MYFEQYKLNNNKILIYYEYIFTLIILPSQILDIHTYYVKERQILGE